MRGDSDESWFETQNFLGGQHDKHEHRTWMVVGLTAVIMVVEIAAGFLVQLDGAAGRQLHAGAMGLSALAYGFARRHACNPRFTFGTGKVGDLAGHRA